MNTYSQQDLKRLQTYQIDMLRQFVKICEKYKINYFVIYGTAIGCVRHKGFIPWDDDVDVGMLWDDYQKLRLVSPSEWGESMVLCDPSDANESMVLPYPRLYMKDTVFIPESFASMKERKRNNTGIRYDGIYLDIMIYRRFTSPKTIKRIKTSVIILRKAYQYAKKGKKTGAETGLKRKTIAILENIYNTAVNLLFKSPEQKIWNRYVNLFENKGSFITTLDYPFYNNPEKSMFAEKDLFPLMEMPFEDFTVKMINGYDQNLHNIYGDYMSLPAEDERTNHKPAVLELGKTSRC